MRSIAILAVIAVVLASAVVCVSAGGDSFTDTELSDGTEYGYETFGNDHASYRCTIKSVTSGLTGLYISTTLEGYNVTEIADGAIHAQECRYIVVPDHVTKIGRDVFSDCPKLESIYFLGDRPSMPDIPEGISVFRLPSASGWGSERLIEETSCINSDGSVVRYCVIEGSAMVLSATPSRNGHVEIASVIGGATVESIGPYAFGGRDWPGMDAVEPRTDIVSVSIPDSVSIIRERAFYYNTGIKEVIIPDSVHVIMDEAFRAATSLESADMGGYVTYLGFESFRHCTSLTSIDIPDSVTFAGEGVFKVCSSAETIRIGAGLGRIPDWAFSYCSSASSVTFGGNVVAVGNSAFYMCSSLKAVSLPDSVETIGNKAFYDCRALSSVSLGSSLKEIGSGSFEECRVLDGVTVPKTVTSVGNAAFAYCSGLTDMYFLGDMPEFGKSVFLNTDVVIHCTSDSEASWSAYQGTVVADISLDIDDRKSNWMFIAVFAVVAIVIAAVAVYYKGR